MNTPLVSVLMCVYNDELYLEESIDCILSQSLTNLEFIIINDGSNQKTSEIINSITDRRIRIIINQTNLGLTRSLNKGLSLAQGKYIARQDANDVSLPKRLQKQFDFMESHDCSLMGCGVIYIDEIGKEISRFLPSTTEDELKNLIIKNNQLTHSSIFFKNRQGIQYRDKFIFAQDYDLYLRLITETKKISVIPEYLIKYRIQKTAISFQKRAQQFLFREKAREFYHERISSGTDSYESFDPAEILKFDIETTTNTKLIAEQIRAFHHSGDYLKVRRFCQRYIFHLKKYDKMICYFILSFFPKWIISPADKIISILNSFKK